MASLRKRCPTVSPIIEGGGGRETPRHKKSNGHLETWIHVTNQGKICVENNFFWGCKCSVSRGRPFQEDKRMVLEYTHGLFIT